METSFHSLIFKKIADFSGLRTRRNSARKALNAYCRRNGVTYAELSKYRNPPKEFRRFMGRSSQLDCLAESLQILFAKDRIRIPLTQLGIPMPIGSQWRPGRIPALPIKVISLTQSFKGDGGEYPFWKQNLEYSKLCTENIALRKRNAELSKLISDTKAELDLTLVRSWSYGRYISQRCIDVEHELAHRGDNPPIELVQNRPVSPVDDGPHVATSISSRPSLLGPAVNNLLSASRIAELRRIAMRHVNSE